MINYENIKIEGAHTKGFEATYENKVLSFAKGLLCLGTTEYEYKEGFSFDVVGDIEIPVLYNVFLTRNNGEPSVAVHRVEMLNGLPQGIGQEEDEELLHLLATFTVPANSIYFDVEVRLLERVVQNEY